MHTGHLGRDDSVVMRWHHALHPSVHYHNPRNGLPRCSQHFIHPTHAILLRDGDESCSWTSRDHRKNRYKDLAPSQSRRSGSNVFQRLGHMTRLEYWNVSWWVAILFTLGSIVWVINGFVAFLPNIDSQVPESDSSIGWTAWLGATIFEIGSIFGILEAWNREDAAEFGWNVRQYLHHPKSSNPDHERPSSSDRDKSEYPGKPPTRWIWFSADTKYLHELGFLAAFSQLCAATIFWISGWTAIPSIQAAISEDTGVLDGVFWTPQVLGGLGFMISATFIMLEAQQKWYKPDIRSLGWHVGFWNFIGAVGFMLCGALGYAAEASSKANYQSSLSTFWGGWAFLIGSVIQWYEAVNSV
ncbi:hypothetical protein FPV67DRAFT_1669692 [Lyophyllum atratum]|nr:hypothetical protein FPV67DRAFT_1669692 [Lyophyllum atratum]